ncbi:MAG: ParB/RepB/Spo0J family partition protein, partial [Selenomonadaceae bacterium]
MDDDAATIIMVDSNLQRENILPSERAKAYKMKLEAMKRQAGRPAKDNCGQVGHNLSGIKTRDLIAQDAPDCARQVQRYVRLNELAQPLLEMVDDKKIAFNPAVELSYLKPKEQELLLTTMESEQATPSVSQAKRLKKFSQEGHLTEDSMLAIMSEEKKDVDKLTLSGDTLKKYFPHTYTPQQIEDTIIKLLEQW